MAEKIVDVCTAAVVWRPDDGSPAESLRLPTESERNALQARLSRLKTMLSGIANNRQAEALATAAILEMLAGFASLRNDDLNARAQGMMMDLRALPLWAIETACRRVKQAEVPGLSLDFAPTSPRMFQIAAAELVPIRAEEKQIADTLALQPRGGPTTEEKARVGEKFQELSRKLREAAPAESDPVRVASVTLDRANKRFLARECEAAGLSDTHASPELIRSNQEYLERLDAAAKDSAAAKAHGGGT